MSKVICPISGITYTLSHNFTSFRTLIHPSIAQTSQDTLVRIAPKYLRQELPAPETHLFLCALLRTSGLVKFQAPLLPAQAHLEALPAVLSLILQIRTFPQTALPQLPHLCISTTNTPNLSAWSESCAEILSLARLSSRQSRTAELAQLKQSKLERAVAKVLTYRTGKPGLVLRTIHQWLANTIEDWPTEPQVAQQWKHYICNLAQPDHWLHSHLDREVLDTIEEFITATIQDISAPPVQYILRAITSAKMRSEKYLGLGGYVILESTTASTPSASPLPYPIESDYHDKLTYLLALNAYRRSLR